MGLNLLSISREVDALVNRFYSETTAPFWPPERAIVEAGQRHSIPVRGNLATAIRNGDAVRLDELVGYLRTWSATQRYIASRGSDPVIPLVDELRKVWDGEELPRLVRWPLALRIGSKSD